MTFASETIGWSLTRNGYFGKRRIFLPIGFFWFEVEMSGFVPDENGIKACLSGACSLFFYRSWITWILSSLWKPRKFYQIFPLEMSMWSAILQKLLKVGPATISQWVNGMDETRLGGFQTPRIRFWSALKLRLRDTEIMTEHDVAPKLKWLQLSTSQNSRKHPILSRKHR